MKETSVRTSTVWEEYLRTIDYLREGRKTVFSPFGIRNTISRCFPSFSMDIQQDAQELMQILLDSLGQESQSWGGSGWEAASKGQLCSVISCDKCQHTSSSYEDFNILSLEIPVGRPKLSVMDCWREFCKEEQLSMEDNRWQCGNCGQGERATKRYKLFREPSLLIVHLKRFVVSSGRMLKRTEPVVVPLQIEPMATSFQLRGLVRHHGQSLSSGHYTAEVQEGDRWWIYNDRSVSNTTRDRDRESREAYLLFFVGGQE